MTEFSTETAATVFYRTYSRQKHDGTQETWQEAVERVVDGNLGLVEERYIEDGERDRLVKLIRDFKVLPAGRHIKNAGVNTFALNNCWAAGWEDDKPSEHFTFTLLRLAEGGGVGSNYSGRYLYRMPIVENEVDVHIVCDPVHPDYEDMKAAGLLSTEYSHEWAGSYGVEDSRQGWADALEDLIETAHDPYMKHKERVYDVTRVRRKGAPLRSFGGTASGPAPFAEMLIDVGAVLSDCAGWPLTGMDAMEIDHEIARCIVSGGVRRSARMSIMRWDDRLIHEFLTAKADQSMHWTTNISVEINDEFIQLVNESVQVGNHRQASALLVLEALAEGALTNGEPGFWNSDLTAVGEFDGTFTTNPCGEATLTPWEPCNLGSVNLSKFVDHSGIVDFEGLYEAHRLVTRYLIRATCAPVADPKSAEAIARYRRIGVGHLGFADFIAIQGVLYSEAPQDSMIRAQLSIMANSVDEAAAEYASQMRIPVPIKTRVIAPTGTISKLAGVSGEGIHPPFADFFIRRIRFSELEPTEAAKVQEYREAGYNVVRDIYAANTSVVEIPTKDPLVDKLMSPEYGQHAGMLSLDQMLAVQELYQTYWADQAVSYTANVDPEKYSAEDVTEMLLKYMSTLKGSTIFPEVSRELAPYERISREEYLRLAQVVGIESTDTSYDELCASGACPAW